MVFYSGCGDMSGGDTYRACWSTLPHTCLQKKKDFIRTDGKAYPIRVWYGLAVDAIYNAVVRRRFQHAVGLVSVVAHASLFQLQHLIGVTPYAQPWPMKQRCRHPRYGMSGSSISQRGRQGVRYVGGRPPRTAGGLRASGGYLVMFARLWDWKYYWLIYCK